MKIIRPHVANLIVILLALAGALIFISTNSLHSDSIFPESIRQDLLNGISLSGWHFSDSLYIFPDWLLWFGIRGLASDLTVSLFLHSFCMFLGIFFWIKAQYSEDYLELPLTIIVIFIWFGLYQNEWWVFSMPVHHGTALVIGLWWTHFYFKIQNIKPKHFVLFTLFAALTCASDPFFGLWFLLPAGLTSLLYRQELKKRSLMGLSIIALTFIFYKMFIWLTGVGAHEGMGISFFQDHGVTINKLFNYFSTFKFKILILALGVFFLIRRMSITSTFYILSAFVTLVFIVSTGLWRDEHSVRYFLPMSFFLILPLSPLPFFIKYRPIKFTLFLCCFLFGFITLMDKNKFEINTQKQSVACIDINLARFNLATKPGLATYWAYKMNLALSEHKLSMRQIRDNWMNYDLLTNDLWKPNTDKYHYLIITPQDKMIPIGQNEMGAAIDCQKYILVFPKTFFYLR